ncbi:MAG: RHS repeat protein, partial [bacterium]|nr:RHS repeat protein [bacterium]
MVGISRGWRGRIAALVAVVVLATASPLAGGHIGAAQEPSFPTSVTEWEWFYSLGTLGGTTSGPIEFDPTGWSYASDINTSGEVVGWSNAPDPATDAPVPGNPEDIGERPEPFHYGLGDSQLSSLQSGCEPGYESRESIQIGEDSSVFYLCRDSYPPPNDSVSLRRRPPGGSPETLELPIPADAQPGSSVDWFAIQDVNDVGDLLVQVTYDDDDDATPTDKAVWLWKNDSPAEFVEVPVGSFAMNDSRVVIGNETDPRIGFSWTEAGDKVDFEHPAPASRQETTVRDLNNAGVAVGSALVNCGECSADDAVWWEADGTPHLIDSHSSRRMDESAEFVNEQGVIAGTTYAEGDNVAFKSFDAVGVPPIGNYVLPTGVIPYDRISGGSSPVALTEGGIVIGTMPELGAVVFDEWGFVNPIRSAQDGENAIVVAAAGDYIVGQWAPPGTQCATGSPQFDYCGYFGHAFLVNVEDFLEAESLGRKIAGVNATNGDHGDPVNAASGRLHTTEPDLPAPVGVYGLGWERTYNSVAGASKRALGQAWTSTFDMTLHQFEGRLVLTEADGRVREFPPDGQGGWNPPPELFAVLSEDPGGPASGDELWIVTFESGEAWTFDQATDQLVELDNGAGQTVSVEFGGPAGSLSKATSSTGHELVFTDADSDGLTDTVSGPGGVCVDYGYADHGRGDILSTVSAPYTCGGSAVTLDEYVYDGLLLTEVYEYREQGQPRELVLANTYDLAGRVESQTTPLGSTITYDYQVEVDQQSGAEVARRTVVTDTAPSGDEETVTYRLDLDGRLIELIDPNDQSINKSWDNDQLTDFTSRSSATTKHVFDDDGRLEMRVYPNPDTGGLPPITNPPDAGAQTGEFEFYTYDGNDRLEKFRDRAGVITRYTYDDADDNPDHITIADGTPEAATTDLEWTSDGLVKETSDPDDVVTERYWSSTSRQLEAEVTVHGTTYRNYDTAGRLTATRNAAEEETWFTYTPAGLLETTTGPMDYTRSCSGVYCDLPHGTPPAGTPQVTNSYYLDGSVKAMTDPDGNLAVEYTYTADGQVETEKRWIDHTQGTFSTTTYAYDEVGRLARVTEAAGTTDAAVTTYRYGTLGRLESVTDPVGVVTQFCYDVDGNRTDVVVDPNPVDCATLGVP